MSSQRVYKTEGIVLKRKNIGEADRVLTVFTKHYGKLKVIAKGVRRVSSRRAPHLEIFTRVSLVLHQGKTLEHVTEVETLDAFEDVRRDIRRVSLGYYACELVDLLLADRQEQDDVYQLFTSVLVGIATLGERQIYAHMHGFTLELLWTLGFLPRTKTLRGPTLQAFVESITERKIKSTDFAKLFVPPRSSA